MRKLALIDRGGRATGLGKLMSEQIMPRLSGQQPASWGQTAKDAAADIGRTAIAPFSGPPLNLPFVAATGKTEFGLGYDQRTAGENKAPYWGATLGTLNPLVGPAVGSGGQTGSELGRIGNRLGSIVGLQNSQSPFSIVRASATAFKNRNDIHTDDQSFAPSEYLPLKQALLNGNQEAAKDAYTQLLSEKAQQHSSLSDDVAKHEAMMDMQKEFSKLENFRFVNKESEATFKASLSPNQRALYDTAVAQQKQIADAFFQMQPKVDNKRRGGFQAPKAPHFSKQF